MTHAIEPIRAAFLTPKENLFPVMDTLNSASCLLGFDVVCFALAVWVIKRRL